MMRSVLQRLSPWGPLLFGLGFLGPLLSTLVDRVGITAPLGLSSLQFGLAVGAIWGTYAKFRGRWL
jgi:ABC-type dipeptide/oligopeptide/nickel transport system permease component